MKAEPGKFNLWIGKNSQEGLMATFELLPADALEE